MNLYYTTMRPPAPGTIPKNVDEVRIYDDRKEVELSDGSKIMAWGQVSSYIPLSDEDIKRYELVPFACWEEYT